ncbi:hypothetical protein MBCUT_05910 [Methanobrevibacter cuticularis]|uniref:Uncharacterized protein n=1 Tax=Methanobrevibacter cuticularis TaxID=47311 RepID=A0A166CTN5_9EURY|nr:hypothetical protein MBCUT_05910 [Methanobrevibacter cuticularis]
MGFCKNCIYYGLVDDYYRIGRWSAGCTLTGELKGDNDSCESFVPK